MQPEGLETSTKRHSTEEGVAPGPSQGPSTGPGRGPNTGPNRGPSTGSNRVSGRGPSSGPGPTTVVSGVGKTTQPGEPHMAGPGEDSRHPTRPVSGDAVRTSERDRTTTGHTASHTTGHSTAHTTTVTPSLQRIEAPGRSSERPVADQSKLSMSKNEARVDSLGGGETKDGRHNSGSNSNSGGRSRDIPTTTTTNVPTLTSSGPGRMGGNSSSSRPWGQPEPVSGSQGGGGGGGGVISAPPGFQSLAKHHLRPQHSTFTDHTTIYTPATTSTATTTITQPPHSTTTPTTCPPGVVGTQVPPPPTQISQQKKPEPQQSQQKIPQIQQQQQQQQPPGGHRQWTYWPTVALPQGLQLPSKPQKEEAEKCKPYEASSPVCSSGGQQTNHQQQQYPYSISPAALFHMASQAAGGQVSAMMLPGMGGQGGGGTKTGLSGGSSGTLDDPSSPTTHPPPGFSNPVAIGYPGQPSDPIPINKLMVGSPLYRSPISQSDSQASPATPSFLTMSQAGSGPLAGMYLQQVGGSAGAGGPSYQSLAITPQQTLPDSSLTHHHQHQQQQQQQQQSFHTRHYMTQQTLAQGSLQGPLQSMAPGTPGPHHQSVGQGPHQVAPGLHQSLSQSVASSVPPGMPQGATGIPITPSGLPGSLPPSGLSASLPPSGLPGSLPSGLPGSLPPSGLPQGLSSTVSGVNLGSAMSQGLAGVGLPLGHPLQQHPFTQSPFPQQGYQMMGGVSSFCPEFMVGEPGLQNPSGSSQQGATQPEMMADVTFQRADVYDGTSLQPLTQFLPSSLPQHQSLISHPSMSQPHPSMSQPHPSMSQPHPSLSHHLSHPSLAQPQQGLPPSLAQGHPSLGQPHPSLGQPHPSLTQPHPSLGQPHPNLGHPGLGLSHHSNGPAPTYTPASLLYIESERDTSQVIQ